MDEAITRAKVHLEELLTFFGVNAKVQVKQEDDRIELTVDADTAGQLIGHKGETLMAIQHLVNMMVRNHTTERLYVGVDIAGYKQARTEQLMQQAQTWAQKVISSGEEESLRPMNARERRIVHMALSEIPGIVTESVGVDPKRRIVIKKAD
jgi:spoIIIJ-associated protein